MTLVLPNADNFILGIIPDSLGLLLFGVVMILAAALTRRILSRSDEQQPVEKSEQTRKQTVNNQNVSRTTSEQAVCR